MQQQNRSELEALTYGNLPNNTAGDIDPEKLREVVLALIASYLNLLDDGNPGAGPGAGASVPGQQQTTFGNLGGQAQDNPSLVTYLASLGHALLEFTPPLLTQARQWYLTSTGIWEAKSSFNAQAAPAANAYWRLVVGFGDALTATAAGKALLAAPTALAQRTLLDIFTTTAGQYGTGQPAFTNAYGVDGALVYLLGQADYLRTQVVSMASPAQPVLPVVTGFLPASGVVGASITITGTGFNKATAVAFNGTAASFQVLNATTIVVTVPPAAITGPVAVSTAAGSGKSAASFKVTAVPAATTPGTAGPAFAGFTTERISAFPFTTALPTSYENIVGVWVDGLLNDKPSADNADAPHYTLVFDADGLVTVGAVGDVPSPIPTGTSITYIATAGGSGGSTNSLTVSVNAQRLATISPAITASDYEYQFRPAPTVDAQRQADISLTLNAGETFSDYEYQARS